MNKRLVILVWKQFIERKLRTSLTIVGILIGISALVSLVILSNGLKSGITSQLDRFGADEILFAPKAGLGVGSGPSGTGGLTTDDVETLETIPQLIEIDPMINQQFDIEYGREDKKLNVRATEIDENFEDFVGLDVLQGRYLNSNDRNSINIGYRIAKEAFDKEIFVGNSLEINGDKYRVVGIFAEEGSAEDDNIIIAPIDSLRDTLGDNKAVTAIKATVSPGSDPKRLIEVAKDKLERKRGKDDIEVVTPEEIKEQIGSLLGIVNIIVISIALISLFVASLGIMNSLYTSVKQRTREIGTMKAIGAKNSQILSIFIVESAILGFVGGVVGILTGLLLAFLMITGFNTIGYVKVEFAISWGLITFSLLLSIALGIISGLLPALSASKQDPVEALRYE